jgi:hypothetical protein
MTKTSKPSLAETHPELAAQADGWDPTTLTAGSNKKVGWKCELGHFWESIVGNRVKGSACPICSGQLPNVGVNDLATVNPALAAQAFGWDPSHFLPKSGSKQTWKCPLGHIFDAVIGNRSREGASGCPVCSGHRVLKGFNDLATTDPELAREAFGWDPTTVTRGSGFLASWQCKNGHVWDTPVNARACKGRGCGICNNQILLVGYNDLATIAPKLALQAHGWDPRTKLAGSTHKAEWICDEGHIWESTLTNRIRGKGCPTCSGKRVLVGFNDLATLQPHIAAEAHGWDPTTVTVSSKRSRDWICPLGHVYEAVVYSRQNSNCPVCAGRQVVPGFNDLASANPELAAEAYGWDPTTKTKYSPQKVKWKCPIGHVYSAAINNRSGGKGCSYCSSAQVLAGFNDFKFNFPELAHQADGWDPSTVTKASGKRMPWVCDLGHKWKAPVSDRSHGQGCPSCAKSGFDPNKQGFLYLIDHFDLNMFQIGISNFPDDRLNDHKRRGWTVIELRGPMDGHLTQKLETDCLHALEKRGAVLGHKAGIEKFDGYSEAWTKASLNVTSIKQILDWVYEDETK